jgi:hypothetical protein
MLLTTFTGKDLLGKEAIAQQYEEVKARLLAEAATPLEMLLASRAALCWLTSCLADLDEHATALWYRIVPWRVPL